MGLQPHTLYILDQLNPGLQSLQVGSMVTVTYHEPNRSHHDVEVRVNEVHHERGVIRATTVAKRLSPSTPVEISIMDRDLRVDTAPRS